MPASWTPDFDFYLATRSGDRLFQRIDMEARQHAPLATHPVLALIDVTLTDPRDDGLRSHEETDAIFDYQDALVRTVQELADGIFWGLRIMKGTNSFEFYLPPAEGREIAKKLAPITEIPGYQPTLRILQDPQWTEYLSAFPNDFFLQTMQNRSVQLALQKAGDTLVKRRPIDHSTIFGTVEDAKRAVPGLRRAKFRSFTFSGYDDDGTMLTFQRRDACDGIKPDDTLIEILDVIEPFGGRYDGWGCIAQR